MTTKEKLFFDLNSLDLSKELAVYTEFGQNVLLSVFTRSSAGFSLERYIFKSGEKQATSSRVLGFVLVSGLSPSKEFSSVIETDGTLCTVVLSDEDKSTSEDGKILRWEINNKGFSKSNVVVKPEVHRVGKRGRLLN